MQRYTLHKRYFHEKDNAIRFRKVKIYENSTLYDIKTLNFEKNQRFTL